MAAKKKVLIVEDEESIGEALTFLMRREGCEVYLVRDGELAVTASQTARFDLIILDLMLPRVPGLDVLRLVRAQALNKDTPVFVLTARGQENDQERAMAVGASRFMTKPFVNADLVREALNLMGED